MKGQRRALSVLGLACLVAVVGMLYVADLLGFQGPSLASPPQPEGAAVEEGSRAGELTCTEPITVGVITDLTGALATYGEHIARSFPLGMEYVAGPPVEPDVYMVDGCEVRLIWGDDQSTPDVTAAIAHEMIDVLGARILVGTVSSGATATLQQIAADSNILLVVAPAWGNEITGANFNENTFRVSRSNYQDAVNLCQYLGPGKKLIQIAPNYPFGWGPAPALRDACRFFGSSFVADDILAPPGTTDFTPYAQQIADSGADACLVTWTGGGMIALLQALADAGVVDQMEVVTSFVNHALIPVFFVNIVGETGGITYHYTFPTNPVNDWLTTETVARYGVPPDLFYADGMNAALLIVEALRATGFDTDAAALIAAMEGMSFDGPKGTVSIRPEDHVAMQDMYIATLLNVTDPEARFFGLVGTNRPTSPCLLPSHLQERCGDLPVGTLWQPIYVDADAAGNNDGTSWEDAYTALQPALEEAAASDEIWVAAGTYTPTWRSSPDDPRSATFQLKNGVALYGGFDPTVGDDEWAERDWVNNVTVLSGDLNGDDVPPFGNNGENSYHVFYHPTELALDGSAVLDGFAVISGNADGGSVHYYGGGMLNFGSSPTVTNCTFSGNSCLFYGGGMCNMSSSSPTVTNCTFSGNSSNPNHGGGMYNSLSSPIVANCTFSGNSAAYGGGMMNDYGSSPTVTNCTFSDNLAMYGGGMCNWSSTPTVSNCTFSGNVTSGGGAMLNQHTSPAITNCILLGDSPDEIRNGYGGFPVVTYSDIQGGYEGEGNIDTDPLFVDPANGDYHLRPGSPCIDAGSNDAPNLPATDFEGDPRIMDGNRDGTAVVDMGVDEVYGYRLYLPLIFRSY